MAIEEGTTFVLVHAAWHGGWAWHPVVKFLTEKGHTCYAPTMPGSFPGVSNEIKGKITLQVGHEVTVQCTCMLIKSCSFG